MRKLLFIFAIGAMVALTACGSGSTTNGTNDSIPALTPDTTKVDTLKIKVDTTKVVTPVVSKVK